MPEHNDVQIILDALRRIVQALRRASARYERDVSLTSAQVFVLKTLQTRPGCSVNDLAAATHTHQSTISELVSRLESRGLIERRTSAEDRRRVELRLSEVGMDMIGAETRTPQEDLVAAIAGLPDDKRMALADGLISLVAAAGIEDETAQLFFEPQDKV
jgi:DNA-binding MarR family transcriptional regulator